jgi:hypothetical protein
MKMKQFLSRLTPSARPKHLHGKHRSLQTLKLNMDGQFNHQLQSLLSNQGEEDTCKTHYCNVTIALEKHVLHQDRTANPST